MRRFSKEDAMPARRFRPQMESDRSPRTREATCAFVFRPEGPTFRLARNSARRIARQIFVSKFRARQTLSEPLGRVLGAPLEVDALAPCLELTE
jgi:hypothetical protein